MSLKNKLSYLDVDVKDKRVLVRVDFNVPLDSSKRVTNPQRIVGAKQTIDTVRKNGAKAVVLMSHLGRPDGMRNEGDSLKHIVSEAEKQLGTKIHFVGDCVGPQVEEIVNQQTGGSIVLLENLRFHLEEEGKRKVKGEPDVKADKAELEKFRKGLTALGDVYINDAFGTAHRAHSSMVGISLPDRAAGALMKRELDYFAAALESPKRKFVAMLGGSKVTDKIQLIKSMLDRVDTLIIFGAMTYTFSKVAGVEIGSSRFDEPGSHVVDELKQKAENNNVELIIPDDHVVAQKIDDSAETKTVEDTEGIPAGWMGLDIGPRSITKIQDTLLSPSTHTVLWNGPPGVFEVDKFANGTKQVMNAAVEAAKTRTVIIGGGDTATVAAKYGVEDKLSHVSTGGGASLELLEGKELPGVQALSTK